MSRITKKINFSIPARTVDRLRRISEALDIPMSRLIVRGLERYVFPTYEEAASKEQAAEEVRHEQA